MADVFISYSKSDAKWARRIAESLTAAGVTVWWDTEGLTAGGEFASEIERQLDEAGKVLVLWSKRSARSEWVRDEADHAKRQGKLVSVIIDDLPLPPLGFRQRHAVSIRSWSGALGDPSFGEILEALGVTLPAETSADAVTAPRPSVASSGPSAAPVEERSQPRFGFWWPAALLALAAVMEAVLRWGFLPDVGFEAEWGVIGNAWVIEHWVAIGAFLAAGVCALARPQWTGIVLGCAIAATAANAADDAVFSILDSPTATAFLDVLAPEAYAQEPAVEDAPSEASSADEQRSNNIATASGIFGVAVFALGLLLVREWRKSAAAWAWGLLCLGCVASLILSVLLYPSDATWNVFGVVQAGKLHFIALLLPPILICVLIAFVGRRAGRLI